LRLMTLHLGQMGLTLARTFMAFCLCEALDAWARDDLVWKMGG
jgi:hypothetical protein